MPTGYTAAIAKGITFREFALQCARAFGACIELRDDPDAPIPEEFKPSTYHAEAMKLAMDKLANLQSMTEEECRIEAMNEFSSDKARFEEAIEEKKALRKKYDEMLSCVIQFQPPTPEHQNFKTFMEEQIRESIDFDCGGDFYENQLAGLKLKSPEEWRAAKIDAAQKSIAYHIKGQKEDEDRAASRSKWVNDLRAALQ